MAVAGCWTLDGTSVPIPPNADIQSNVQQLSTLDSLDRPCEAAALLDNASNANSALLDGYVTTIVMRNTRCGASHAGTALGHGDGPMASSVV